MTTNDTLRTALRRWLEEHPATTPDGRPMVFEDGRPVALVHVEVRQALEALMRWDLLHG